MANYHGALELDGPSHDSHSNDAMDGLNTRFKSFTLEQMSSSSWATTRSPGRCHPPPRFSSSAPSSPSLEPPPWRDRYRTRRSRQKRSDSAPPLPQPPKHCVDQIFDIDGTSIGEIVNRDTDSARSLALDLCFPKSQSRGEDIVFWTDASYGSITESKSGAHGQVKQWDQMKQNPEKWRAGVAIAWDVAHSSGLRRRQHRVNTGAWRDEYYTLLSSPRAPNNHHHSSWHANHEAAWQVTGLQHYNQAELLGVTLALQRAVDILRHSPPSRSSQWPPQPTARSVTILTDSKPAMWDLTGDNWHDNSVRTDSEYWAIREANTAAIVAEGRRYMRELRDMNVRVKVTWVPRHVGIPGNEWVDGLSRFARLSGSRFEGRCGWRGGETRVGWERVERRLVLDSDGDCR